MANTALDLKISILKVKFIVGTSKFINYNHTIYDINFQVPSQKTLNFIYQIPVASQLPIFILKFKNHSGLAALKSRIEIRLNNIHITCKPLKRKFYI